MKWCRLFSIFTIIALSATSCAMPSGNQSATITCDSVVSQSMTSLFDDSTRTVSEMKGWIEEHFQISEDAVQVMDYTGIERESDITLNLKWEYQGKTYTGRFVGEEIRQLSIRWSEDELPLRVILDCFGPPEFYRAHLFQIAHGDELRLDLWYPSKGILFRHVQFGDFIGPSDAHQTPILNDDSPIKYILLVKPGERTEVSRDFYAIFSPDPSPTILETLKPWPESMEEIIIDESWP